MATPDPDMTSAIRIAKSQDELDRFSVKKFSQYDMDYATKVLDVEITRLTQERDTLRAELSAVDEALARRPALGDIDTRYGKIERACAEAGKTDTLRAENEWLKAKNSERCDVHPVHPVTGRICERSVLGCVVQHKVEPR